MDGFGRSAFWRSSFEDGLGRSAFRRSSEAVWIKEDPHAWAAKWLVGDPLFRTPSPDCFGRAAFGL